jgi:hypothetical protein
MENPFRPSAGAAPPEILGRAGGLDEFEYGLRLLSGAPGLLTIFTCARGIGKTVMLGAAHDLAREQGWQLFRRLPLKASWDVSGNPCGSWRR